MQIVIGTTNPHLYAAQLATLLVRQQDVFRWSLGRPRSRCRRCHIEAFLVFIRLQAPISDFAVPELAVHSDFKGELFFYRNDCQIVYKHGF